jgi:protein TonB
VGVGIALLAMKLNAPEEIDPPVLTVQWLPTQTNEPAPKPQEKPKDPPPKKRLPDPVQKPVQQPQTKPVEAPLIQAPATAAPAVAETPVAPPTPPTPPQAAPVVAPTPPVDPNLKPNVDCTQSPAPSYPIASIKQGEEGTVMLRLQVDERGHPVRVEIEKSSGYARLDRAAHDTVASSWVCPLSSGRQRIAGGMRLPISFVLPPL